MSVCWVGEGLLALSDPVRPGARVDVMLTVGAVPFEAVIEVTVLGAEDWSFECSVDRALLKAAVMVPDVPWGTAGAARFGRVTGHPYVHAVLGRRRLAIPLATAAGFTGDADLAELAEPFDAEAAVDSWLAEVQP